MQAEIDTIMKKHNDGGANNAKLYDWQTSDDNQKGDSGSKYSFFTLLLIFTLSAMLGAYLVRPAAVQAAVSQAAAGGDAK